jgi:hypothetical protein
MAKSTKKLPPRFSVDVHVRRDGLAWRYELIPHDGVPLDISDYRFETKEGAREAGDQALSALYAPKTTKRPMRHK